MRPAFASTLLAVACVVAMAPKAYSQTRQMAQVDSQLARVKRSLGARYFESRQVIMRSGADSTVRQEDLNPSRGTYVFAGAGDDSVTALKLRLYDRSGAIVAGDTSGTRTPRFEFTVPQPGVWYRLEMMLDGCRRSLCYFGVQVYQRR